MRLLPAILLPLAACATAPHIVETSSDQVVQASSLGRELAQADVVVLGEMHGVKSVHRTHHAVIAEIHKQRPNIVIAMEMFERDVQNDLLQYLAGITDEETFLANSRPWGNYASDYRPVIEFARQNGIVVLAANAPRPLARKVAIEGVESVVGHEHVARKTTAPEDAYWDAFVDAMGEHGGMSGASAMERFYQAQCLKDDTMAESICDHLTKYGGENRPLAIFICGKMHSDYRRGTVQRILGRMPDLDVRVMSVEMIDEPGAGIYTSPRAVADYVILTHERPPQPKMPPPRTVKVAEEHGEAAVEIEDHEGMRPALGFMPAYGTNDPGVLVEVLREGGPAEKGGLEEGDVIVELGGEPIADVTDYSEVLDELKIGSKVAVRVKRGENTIDLEVVVGSRPGR